MHVRALRACAVCPEVRHFERLVDRIGMDGIGRGVQRGRQPKRGGKKPEQQTVENCLASIAHNF